MLPPLRYWQKFHQTRNNMAWWGRPRVKLTFRNGQFQIGGLGTWYSYWRDPYHLLLTIPWTGFLGLLIAAFGLVNGLFAVLYLLGGDCIANAKPGSFGDAFFFSVQTLASIGYGAMYPTTLYADIVVTIEALVSILSIALMTGLAFARFSQPTARVIFSQAVVIAPYNGIPTLMLRVANQRSNQIIEAEMRLYYLQDEVSAEGDFFRRFYELPLIRHRTPVFTLTWTAMHPIDDRSPLFGVTEEMLATVRSMLIVSLNGVDETVAQTIHARYSYGSQDILWNQTFVDMLKVSPDGHRYIDFSYFHEVKPIGTQS